MILRVAVCDDDTEMLNILSKKLDAAFKEQKSSIELETFLDGKQLLDKHKEQPFHAVFLDIFLPAMDGFQIAEELISYNRRTCIIFVTSRDELVYESFDYRPFHFIRKENDESLNEQICHVAEKLITFHKYFYTIKLPRPHGSVEEVVVGDIIMVRSDKNYLEYELKDAKVIRIRGSLLEAEETLKNYDLVRINNRVLVNLNYVAKIKAGEVILRSGFVYTLSRNNKKSVEEAYMKYLRSRK